jgi:uncharacterized protein YceK
MRTVKTLKGVVLMVALAAVASGCAGTVKHSSAKACAAHGGTYNAAAKTCTYTASTRSAQQICQQNDGYYDPTNDICSYNP